MDTFPRDARSTAPGRSATVANRPKADIQGVLKDLGTLGGSTSIAYAINATGQVVGSASTATGAIHAFSYANGTMTDLDTLGGIDSWANGVNASGQVTGASFVADDRTEHAFLYSNGETLDLGAPNDQFSVGNGINASGQVVGGYETEIAGIGLVGRAFLYSDGVRHDLGALGGSASMATAINDSGEITGRAAITRDFPEHAFLYSGGVMRDLGTLGGYSSEGKGINAQGQVVGASNPADGQSSAFLYADGAMYDLNLLVVGLADTRLIEADGINATGQIVANGCSKSSICQAFRLDLAPPSVTPTKSEAIEFYFADFDHCFVTALPDEISALDSGAFPGWVRTGQSFSVYSTPSVGTALVRRFFSTSFAPKSSHFYTPDTGEYSFVKAAGGWEFEGVAFAVPVPDQQGLCPQSTQPIYRVFNNGEGGAPDHRYTTSLAIRAQMIVNGWVPEGYGALGVIMCAPL